MKVFRAQGFIQDFELGGGGGGGGRMVAVWKSTLTHVYVCMPTRGVWGHVPPPPPRKILNLDLSSQIASDAIWNKIVV